MRNKIIAVICIVISVVGAVFLFTEVRKHNASLEKDSAVYEELADKLQTLEAERRDAEEAISELEKKIGDTGGHATASILFRGMSEDIYTKAYPDMKEMGMAGTLIVTADRLPGGEGLISAEQVTELVADGWKIIPGWTDDDGENGITAADRWIKDNGYDAEGVAFMMESDVTDERVALITGSGYNTVVLNVYKVKDGIISTDPIGDIWKPNSMGYKVSGAQNSLNSAVMSGANIVYVISFEDDREMYHENSFPNMLTKISDYQKDGSIKVTDIASARAYHTEMDAKRKENEALIAPEISAYEEKIAQIEEKIEKLYKEYE